MENIISINTLTPTIPPIPPSYLCYTKLLII